jgi:hypothetical protein
VYRVEQGETVDTVSLGMLTNNKIAGLAPLYYTQSDSDIFLKYSVTSKIAVRDFFAGEVNRRRLSGVISGIASSADAAEEYMLDSSLFVLESEYIFVDVTTLQTSLICLPVAGRIADAPCLRGFFKELMMNARYDMRESCDYVAGIISCLNEDGPFTLSGLRNVAGHFERLKEDAAEGAAPEPAVPAPAEPEPAESGVDRVEGESGSVRDDGAVAVAEISLPYLLTHYSRENKSLYKRGRNRGGDGKRAAATAARPADARARDGGFAVPGEAAPPISGAPPMTVAPAKRNARAARRTRVSPPPPQTPEKPAERAARADFGETTVLGDPGAGETTSLGGAAPAGGDGARPHLIRIKGNERIELDRQVFRMGKEPGYVDYCIEDSGAVSRSHANIVTRGGKCVLLDTNSTNHTYIDGEMIPPGQERPLSHGARIRLASEEFEFRERG